MMNSNNKKMIFNEELGTYTKEQIEAVSSTFVSVNEIIDDLAIVDCTNSIKQFGKIKSIFNIRIKMYSRVGHL